MQNFNDYNLNPNFDLSALSNFDSPPNFDFDDGYTQMTEEEVREEVKDQYEFSKRYLDPIHEKMNQQEELYRAFIDSGTYQHRARVFDPRIFRVIETITPRMVANEPMGSFYPMEDGDVKTTEILNTLMKYDWRRAEMFEKMVRFIKSTLIFGTGFGRCYWDFRESEKPRMVPIEVNGRMVWTPDSVEYVKVTEFDGPNFEVLNIYDCFPDPNAKDLASMRWFIYRTFRTIEELEQENDTRGMEYYKNLDKLRDAIGRTKEDRQASTGKPDDMTYREHRRTMLGTEDLTGQDDSNPEFAVLRRYTRDGWCEVVPEYDVVIRETKGNPYFHQDLPIIYGVDYPYPGELYGMGEIEPVDRIQRAINAVLNQRLDNVQLILNNMWKVRKGSGVDLHTLVSAPGNIIQTEDMDAVEPVNIPDATGGTFVQTMNYLTSALQNGTGITDYTVGMGSNANVANKTATGTRLIQQEANAQFKLKIQLMNHMVIKRIANQWKDLRIQYTTEEQRLRILGQQAIRDLQDNTDFGRVDVRGNEVVPGEQTRRKLEVSPNGKFAFLTVFPDDIQPSIVGEYDFIPTVSSEQLTDPIVLQENFAQALEKVVNPNWQQGLAQQGKMLNFEHLTGKLFDNLNIGLESKDAITDIPRPEDATPNLEDPSQFGVNLRPEDIQGMLRGGGAMS